MSGTSSATRAIAISAAIIPTSSDSGLKINSSTKNCPPCASGSHLFSMLVTITHCL
ncbi:unnamed protein product, partial [Nesidiocoris tenuis]